MFAKDIEEKRFYLNDLFYAYIHDFGKLFDFFSYDYKKIVSYEKRIEVVKRSYDDSHRSCIAEALRSLNEEAGCDKKTLANIECLYDKGSFTVIAGQQPGLFTGPIYTIYKLMSTIRLAGYLSKRLKKDIIPVFWNASDDSVSSHSCMVEFLDKNSKLQEMSLDVKLPVDLRISDTSLDLSSLYEGTKQFTDLMGRTEFSKDIHELLKGKIEKDVQKISLNSFFNQVLHRIFEGSGLVIIDPSDKRLKKLSIGLISEDIDKKGIIEKSIKTRGDQLEEAGFHRQLEVKKDRLDIFYSINGIRKKVSTREDYISIAGKKYSRDDFMDLVSRHYEKVSLNVILRPLFQDKFLPNIATICGPGEISYFAQLKDVYEAFDIGQPVFYPRFSATLIEKKVVKSFKRQSIGVEEILDKKENAIKRLVLSGEEIDINKKMSELKKGLMLKLEEFEGEIKIDHGKDKSPFFRIKKNMQKEIDVLEKKLISVLKQKNSMIISDIEKIYENIFPGGSLQERRINIFYFINRYGKDLVSDLLNEVKAFDFYHKFLEV